MMTNDDREGRICISHPHTNNGFIFLLTTNYLIFIEKKLEKASKNPEYAEMRHGDVILKL